LNHEPGAEPRGSAEKALWIFKGVAYPYFTEARDSQHIQQAELGLFAVTESNYFR
jgi:hypothetical protein